MKNPSYITDIKRVAELTAEEQGALGPVGERFVFRSNTYYHGLIDWDDPDDPIRRIIIPLGGELENWGRLDASDEEAYTVVPGLEHKYGDTALLLVNDVCGGYCRFCFRKRLFMDDNDEVARDIGRGLAYIREHTEISNVLLTGGDPLVMSTERLEGILRRLWEIEHVRIIRIGTKMPAFNPARILRDPKLPALFEKLRHPERKLYVMAHFNHPRELTGPAVEGLGVLLRAGAIVVNQTPLIAGVNDDADTLAALFERLSHTGVPPYYVFQCRPTLGNKPYSVPVEEGFEIFTRAQSRCSGLAARARFVMSHSTGKIEVVGKADGRVFMRYHRSPDPAEGGRLFVFKSNPEAHWFDDYEEAAGVGRGAAGGRRAAARAAL
ncbi:MAG TPA: KamA family radical SAM protein [Pyrinomonadaceae bacterium]|jgi:KamA family protein